MRTQTVDRRLSDSYIGTRGFSFLYFFVLHFLLFRRYKHKPVWKTANSPGMGGGVTFRAFRTRKSVANKSLSTTGKQLLILLDGPKSAKI